jgi:hypothetical protein
MGQPSIIAARNVRCHFAGRRLTAEILDQLDHHDPAAVRSRADIQRVNSLMGNFGWLTQRLRELSAGRRRFRVIELGAGCGTFGRRLARRLPEIDYVAIDLAPEPPNWPKRLGWKQGDALDQLAKLEGEVIVANLFLHHLTDERIRLLGQMAGRFQAMVCNEPARLFHAYCLSLASPVLGINHVTRHDIRVSVEAGFQGAELPRTLGLRPEDWRIKVWHTALGAYRMTAVTTSRQSPPRLGGRI